MWQEEHFSRIALSERLILDFREVLSHCDLHDIGFVGTPWTFDNKQNRYLNVKVRVDRIVASLAWSYISLDHRLRHISSSRSDQCPILIMVECASNYRLDCSIRHCEVVWEREPSIPADVEEASSRQVACQCLGNISSSLRSVMYIL
jgi:hypothetical protein